MAVSVLKTRHKMIAEYSNHESDFQGYIDATATPENIQATADGIRAFKNSGATKSLYVYEILTIGDEV